jgi:5-methylcytosine-specific restriction endonuclease McrA
MNDDRDRRIAYTHKVRAGKLGLNGSFTVEEWKGICAQYDYKCAICGSEEPLTADHIIPMSKDGSNLIQNIQPLCKSCNSRKKDKIPDEVVVREPVVPIPVEYSENWGGKRPGAGRRIRNRLALTREAGEVLHWLTKHQRTMLGNPDLTEEEVISALIERKLKAVQEAYGPVEEAKPAKSGTIIV